MDTPVAICLVGLVAGAKGDDVLLAMALVEIAAGHGRLWLGLWAGKQRGRGMERMFI